MKKELIQTEMERVFPQFNKAEIVAATMAAEWMQDHIIQQSCEWLTEHISVDDEIEMVDENNPEASSYFKAMKHRLEVVKEMQEDYKHRLESR